MQMKQSPGQGWKIVARKHFRRERLVHVACPLAGDEPAQATQPLPADTVGDWIEWLYRSGRWERLVLPAHAGIGEYGTTPAGDHVSREFDRLTIRHALAHPRLVEPNQIQTLVSLHQLGSQGRPAPPKAGESQILHDTLYAHSSRSLSNGLAQRTWLHPVVNADRQQEQEVPLGHEP